MAGLLRGDATKLMSCFYSKDGTFVCQTKGGSAQQSSKAEFIQEGDALVEQLQAREVAKYRLADALATGGMAVDFDDLPGSTAPQELGYEDPPRPGAFLEGMRRPAPDQGMQLSNLAPEPLPAFKPPGHQEALAQKTSWNPSVPRVASLTYNRA